MYQSIKRFNKTTYLFFGFCLISLLLSTACNKDKAAIAIDKKLFDLAKNTDGFVWFKYSEVLLVKSSGSGRSQDFLRTRYNAIAATQLDSNGRIVNGTTFPEGSLIVKELFKNTSTIDRYAILYKESGSEYANANGWVWGYIDANGSVNISADKKGASCINCHTQSNHIDYMLMNKFYP